jgi:ribosomal protein S18 acetylase RimI-like enzyme
VVELTLESTELRLRQPEAREVRDMLDVGAREGGHGPDDSRDMPTPRLRPMTTADIAPTAAAILADDWGDRRAWFTFAVASPHCRVFVAEAADGTVVGTGVATLNGPVAWIGTIWVAPAWRGQGLGRALTEAPIEAAEAAGCRTLVLVATDRGRPLYERLGFVVSAWYRTMEAPGLRATSPAAGEGDPARRLRPYRPSDLELMAAIDAAATGEDRRHLLEAFASPESSRVVVGPDDVARGFVVRATWGGGATIADDPDDAMALLDARRRATTTDRRVRAGVLDLNVDGIARLEAAGWSEAWRAPRLSRGEPLAWHPTAIWGQFNHAVG